MIVLGASHVKNVRCLLLTVLAIISTMAVLSQAVAEPLILQGATTFNRLVFERHKEAIEAKSKQELTIIPNRTMLGVIALMEGRAHMAMISAPLESEVNRLKKEMPKFDYDRLKPFEVLGTRVAFIINPANPVRKASLSQIKKILTGEITNWNALGGKDAPIRTVFVGGGGGVITTVESELLSGERVSAPNLIRVKTALQLVQVVEQESNAFGIAQLSLARQKGLPEIVTDKPIEQSLSLVTLGAPTPAMQAVIDAARNVLAHTMR